jgi:hypothetical protein
VRKASVTLDFSEDFLSAHKLEQVLNETASPRSPNCVRAGFLAARDVSFAQAAKFIDGRTGGRRFLKSGRSDAGEVVTSPSAPGSGDADGKNESSESGKDGENKDESGNQQQVLSATGLGAFVTAIAQTEE